MTTFFRRFGALLSPLLGVLTLVAGLLPGIPLWLRFSLWIILTCFNILWWLLVGPTYTKRDDLHPEILVEWRRLVRSTFAGRLVSALLLIVVTVVVLAAGAILLEGQARASFLGYNVLVLVAMAIGVVDEARRYRKVRHADG